MTSKYPVGTYVLTQTVVNPHGDKRVRHRFWNKSEFEKGTKFIIELFPWELNQDCDLVEHIYPQKGFDPVVMLSKSMKEVMDAVLPHLERVEETPTDWLARVHSIGGWCPDILDHLVKTGKITLADVQTAVEELSKE